MIGYSMPGKRFSDYSKRWQREAIRDGVDPKKWDQWQRLAPSTQRNVDRRQYSKGFPARELAKEKRQQDAVKDILKKLEGKTRGKVRPGRVIKNVKSMSTKQLRSIATKTAEDIMNLAGKHRGGDTPNVWRY